MKAFTPTVAASLLLCAGVSAYTQVSSSHSALPHDHDHHHCQHAPEYSSPRECSIDASSPPSEFWLANLPGAREGISPFLPSNATNGTYQVFRNVKDFGAKGDGVTDDSEAINKAIKAGNRVTGGYGPGGTTGQPALIYFEPGVYVVSATIQMFINTQIIGDALNFPTLKATRNNTYYDGVVLSGYDPGRPSTTNFFTGIRNINIDTTAAAPNSTIHALNWAVSQATSLINVNFMLAQNSKHVGIEMNGGDSGGGSGLNMGDLTFTGGLIGIILNNQQYAIKNVTFNNVGTAISVQHTFVVTFQQIQCQTVEICIDMGKQDGSGSMSLIDSSCNNCNVVVNGTNTALLENVDVTNAGVTLFVDGIAKLRGSLAGKTYVQGHTYKTLDKAIASNGTFLPYTDRGNLVDGTGKYFIKAQPQYADYPASAFVSVKDVGAKGDGKTDDTAAIQAAINANADCKIVYFPHGVYLVTDTIHIPSGSRIVGEVWSTISASGDKFADADSPQPMIQVGREGEVGTMEMSDMLFTVADVLPGTILVEVNMRGSNPGDVSFHNTHYRIGGAIGSKTETACQSNDPCRAAFLMTHLKKGSSTYIDNAWIWAADHDLDGDYNQRIGTGRGVLIEATDGTWLVGTGSEHHTLYAYTLNNAQNVFASLMQVETPYWQPNPRATTPWTPNATWSDPTFEGCARNDSQCYMSWSLRIIGSETHTLPLYGQGFWVFFNNVTDCTGSDGICQTNIVDLEDLSQGSGVELYNLNTKSVENLIRIDGSGGRVAATQDQNPGSWGGVIAAFLAYQ